MAGAADGPVRFALTGAVVRENQKIYDRWAEFLSGRLGRPVEFVQRRTYREIMDLLRDGEIDFAWICSLPFVQQRDPEYLDPLLTPVWNGKPLYQSYIIVNQASSFHSLRDLKNAVFAYSEPESNSGYLVPRAMVLDSGHDPEIFFRYTFFTFSHAETVEAVASRVADGAAVDSYVWEVLQRLRPNLTNQTRVVHRSETYGFPPVVVRRATDPILRQRMNDALESMHKDPTGKAILTNLQLDRFEHLDTSLYDGVRRNALRLHVPPPPNTPRESSGR